MLDSGKTQDFEIFLSERGIGVILIECVYSINVFCIVGRHVGYTSEGPAIHLHTCPISYNQNVSSLLSDLSDISDLPAKAFPIYCT